MDNYQMWIDGKWVNAESGETYTTVNPATGEDIATIAFGDKADADKAVIAARKAFPIWSKTPQQERSRIVREIGVLLRKNNEELAEIDILNHGTPKRIAGLWVNGAADKCDHAAEGGKFLKSEVFTSASNSLVYSRREPIGVCALITPWNGPLLAVIAKLSAALVTGNTCIVKPPSIDTLVALKLGKLLEKLDIPTGTINIVTGPGEIVGKALTSHPDVDKIGFTGSCETGKAIMSCSSDTVKRLQLELGGKNPFVVLEDADIDYTVNEAARVAFVNGGMVCASPGRYYVPEKMYDAFVEKFVAIAKDVVVGDPNDDKTQMGPMVSESHRNKVEGYIKKGIEEGARLVLGGKRPKEPPLDKGFYVMPTVFADVTQDMTIAREEIFGPVVNIIKYSTEDDIISLANENRFGLAGSIWTSDTAKGLKYANELHAGFVWINKHMMIGPDWPWGGFKESGYGFEGGILGLEEYTQLKVIYVDIP